jgi:hypothetical protein
MTQLFIPLLLSLHLSITCNLVQSGDRYILYRYCIARLLKCILFLTLAGEASEARGCQGKQTDKCQRYQS